METIDKSSLWQNWKCLLICSGVAIANTQYGLDTAVVNGLQAMPGFLEVFGFKDPTNPLGYGIEAKVQQLMTSLVNLGACVSALTAGILGYYVGRRPALWTACAICCAASAIQLGATSTSGLYAGRFFLGISNGFLVVFSTVYCSEAAPAHLREIMVGLFSWFVNVGTILGSVIDNYTTKQPGKVAYQIPLACMYIVPVMLSIFLLFVPESPRWLLRQGKAEQARRSLEQLRSDHSDTFEVEWAEMMRGVDEETRLAQGTSVKDLFRGHDLRRTLLCWATLAAQSASGVWFYLGYQTYFLSLAGITKAFQYTILNFCVGFIGVHVGLTCLKRLLGRRTVMMLGALMCGLMELAGAIAASVAPNSKATGNALVALTALFLFCYNAGVGAASTPLATELVSSRLRAWSVGSGNGIQYFLSWLIGFCTPYFINPLELDWGAKYFYIWAASNFICVIFFYFFIPETKARSLEELDEIFEHGIPARKFKSYQCKILEEAKEDVYRREKSDGVRTQERDAAVQGV